MLLSKAWLNIVALLLLTNYFVKSEQTCAADDATCSNNPISDDLENGVCKDDDERCSMWAAVDECVKNPNYMLVHCAKSCGECGGEKEMMTEGYKNYGEPQEVGGEKKEETVDLIYRVNKYMKDEVFALDKYKNVRNECKNRHKLCAFWAVSGECEANPSYMVLNCAPSCFSCEKIDFENRCPRDLSLPDIFKPGDLNKMFENIAFGKEFASYEKTIHSRPKIESRSDGESTNDDVKEGPWVITIDDFLTEEEVNLLIKYGKEEGFVRSTDVGKKNFDGTYDSYENNNRTSKNSWCTTVCYKDPAVKNVLQKIEKLTGIPDQNSEYLQLLQYEDGQYYRTHHDFIDYLVDRNTGPRIVTVFLYLNDVEEGGGTNFPRLDITVMPKMGRVLIWPNALDENLNSSDRRTHHQALPVEKGLKYGANAWLHLRDFKTDYNNNCA